MRKWRRWYWRLRGFLEHCLPFALLLVIWLMAMLLTFKLFG